VTKAGGAGRRPPAAWWGGAGIDAPMPVAPTDLARLCAAWSRLCHDCAPQAETGARAPTVAPEIEAFAQRLRTRP
jgi:hypothetical protein